MQSQNAPRRIPRDLTVVGQALAGLCAGEPSRKPAPFDADQAFQAAARQNGAFAPLHDPKLPTAPEKKSELKAFLFLTVVMAPVLAGVIIGVYGLAVWIYQMFAGPPTG